MFEGCTIKYGNNLSGVRNGIIIEYPAREDGSKDVVCCPIDNPNNRYYKMVMQWVEEGGVISE
jgi:hypothetical protein